MDKKSCLHYGIIVVISMLFILGASTLTLAANDKIELSVKEAPLQEVFRLLAGLADVNLICDTSVQGNITIDLKDVTFEQALNLLTSANDLAYHWMGNAVLIATPEKIAGTFEQKRVETVNLQYKEPEEVSGLLKGIIGEIKIEVNKDNRQLVISGTEDMIKQALEIIKDVDKPVPQVLIEVRVTETSLTENLDLGGSLGEDTGQIEIIKNGDMINGVRVNLPDVYDLSEGKSDYKILANPRLMTLDGKTANLMIGDRVPVRVEKIEDGEKVSTIEYIEAGIKLEFTPRITDDGFIILEVKPQISSLGQELDSGFYQIKTREAHTTLRLKSGETFAIGGLIKSEEIETIKKVPLLGEFPLLGLLLNSKSTTEEKTELIIFITPKIIYPEN